MMLKLKPEVVEFFKSVKAGINEMLQRFSLLFKPGLPGKRAEVKKGRLLRLNLQHFADPGDPPPPPATHDGFYATLKDAFKANPHLRTEHKAAITEAVTDRFGDYNFDVAEAKAALAEKKKRDADKAAGISDESDEVKAIKERAAKLEAKTKKLALDALTGDANKSKLISRLAADKVDALKLNDNFELEEAAVKGIVDELTQEFPDLFPVVPDPQPTLDPITGLPVVPAVPPAIPPTRSSGGTPPLNTPPNPNADIDAIVAETFNKLKESKRF